MNDYWNLENNTSTITVNEQDKRPAVVYDHTGQPYARPKPPMGFIDPRNLLGKK